jgi:hypothetical protein
MFTVDIYIYINIYYILSSIQIITNFDTKGDDDDDDDDYDEHWLNKYYIID